jgi:hypothetical protein
VNYSLLPAIAVAGTVILLQVFVVVATTTPDETDEGSAKGPAREPAKPNRGRRKKEEADLPLAKPKPHGRPKKGKLAEEQLEKEERETGGDSS